MNLQAEPRPGTQRLDPPRKQVVAVTAVAAAAAFVLGPFFVLDPRRAVDVLGAFIFLVLAMTSAGLGLAAWVFAAMFKPAPALVTNLGLIVIAAAWLGSLVVRRPGIANILPGRRYLVGVLALFVAWLTLSLFWARDEELGWQQLRVWMIAVGLLVIVATSVNRPAHVRLIMLAFLIGGLVEVIIGHGIYADGRFSGTGGDADVLASRLLLAIVFGAALIADRQSLRERVVLVAVLVYVSHAFITTESRGGFLALVSVVPAAAFLFRRQRRYVVTAIALGALILGVTLSVSPGARQRIFNFNGGGSGRSTIWLVAWRIARTHQPAGIGLGNFILEAQDYVRQPGVLTAADEVVTRPHIVHNTYLGLLTETGAVGLALYLAAVGSCLASALKASRNFELLGHDDMAWLARAVLLASFAFLSSAFFLSIGNDFCLWITLGLGPALLAMSARTPVLPHAKLA